MKGFLGMDSERGGPAHRTLVTFDIMYHAAERVTGLVLRHKMLRALTHSCTKDLAMV